jgi:uncharacterized protein with PIN domain
MAIRCPGCGREYDVTLFQFGRTLRCACGQLVGLEHRVHPTVDPASPRFIADAMLGRLARWLRTLGHDTAYDDAISDEALVRRALEEGRHILTRDRRLFDEWRIGGGLLLGSDRPLDQLAEVVTAFRLPPSGRRFTRCRVCNGVLRPADMEDVAGRIPPRVRERTREFVVCGTCGRIYWEGSHTDRMRAVLAGLFERL